MHTRDFYTRRTDCQNPEFRLLVVELDSDLSNRDGADHEFYNQFNSVDGLEKVVLAYDREIPVGCGALKPFDADSYEIKRMFVRPSYRGIGVAQKVLSELETWALESGAFRCVLETGKRQPEAIAFYGKSGYSQIENYGPYRGIENSLCFEKQLSAHLRSS